MTDIVCKCGVSRIEDVQCAECGEYFELAEDAPLFEVESHEGTFVNEGTLVMPEYIRWERRGLLGWFYRLINNKRGWSEYKIADHIIRFNHAATPPPENE